MAIKNKKEFLKEEWVEFSRYYCKEGFIDVWIGDCINNPNLSSKSKCQLNSFAWYYRLNGEGEWVNRNKFDYIATLLLELRNNFDAKEIWEQSLRT